jgi:hypothetical protein
MAKVGHGVSPDREFLSREFLPGRADFENGKSPQNAGFLPLS